MNRLAKKRRRCSSSPSPLPLDIIELEILAKLPVKSLLRFKSVCKLWYSVITSHSFISTRYNHPSNRILPLFQEVYGTYAAPTQAITVSPNPNPNPRSKIYGRSWPLVDRNVHEKRGNFLFSYYVGMLTQSIFVRPVNGFVLILCANRKITRLRMAVYNPAARQFRFLIDFELNNGKYVNLFDHLFGYGVCKYSSGNTTPDLYKVVWLCRRPGKKFVIARVYTIGDGDGGWRVINAALPARFVTSYPYAPNRNICINGKCYWLSEDLVHILIFDMDEEVFREMESPISGTTYVRCQFEAHLTEVPCSGGTGNSLALFHFRSEFVDISVMDNEEEWHWIRRIVTYICRPIGDLLSPLMELRLPLTDSIVFKVFNFKESLFSVDGGIQVSDSVLEDFCIF